MSGFGFAVADDETALWYEWAPQASRRRDRTPLLLLNGANCTTHYWPPLLRFLGRRAPAILHDYRGHGRSGRAFDLEAATVETFAADALRVLDHAEAPPAVLVGHSLGVMVALECYRQQPERVAGLILCFGTHGEAWRQLARSPEEAERLTGPLLTAAGEALRPFQRPASTFTQSRLGVWLAEAIGANRALLPEGYIVQLMEHIESMDPRLVFALYRHALLYDASSVLPEIAVPTLVLAGALDRMTPPARAREMARLIPRADLVMLPTGSHLGMLEDEVHVHRRVEGFLRLHGWLEEPA